MGEIETKIAKITKCDIEVKHHWALLDAHWEYENSEAHGGLPMIVMDLDFIKQFMWACDEDKLSDCKGDLIKVTVEREGYSSKLKKISPLNVNEGTEFDIEEWKDKVREEESESLELEEIKRLEDGNAYLLEIGTDDKSEFESVKKYIEDLDLDCKFLVLSKCALDSDVEEIDREYLEGLREEVEELLNKVEGDG